MEIFSVGVGIRQDNTILKEMASDPKSEHFFSTPYPARLTDVLHVIKKKFCKGIKAWRIMLNNILVLNLCPLFHNLYSSLYIKSHETRKIRSDFFKKIK